MAFNFNAPTLEQLAAIAAGQQPAPVDGNSAINNAFMSGVQQERENAAQEAAAVAAEMAGYPQQTAGTNGYQLSASLLNPQATAQPTNFFPMNPQPVVQDQTNGTIENGAVSEAQAEGQEQQAAQEQADAQKAAAQTYDLRKDLLAAIPQDAASPAEQAMNAQLYKDTVAPKLNSTLLPLREAQYAENNAAIQRAYPDTVMGIQRNLVNGLARAKQTYDEAKAAGNEQGMALAHQAAEQIRQQAASIGLDLGQFGGNEDTAAMVQALANNDARAMNSLIGADVTPEQYYQERYNAARNQGFSRRKAEGYAQAQTEKYQADRYAKMQQAFFTYGLNSTGSINPFGVQLFGKMMQDNPETVALYAKMFGLPVDDYKLGNQRTLLSDQNKYTMTQNEQKHGFNMQEIGLKGQIEAQIHALDGQIKSALAKQQFGYAQELQRQRLAAQAYLKSLGGGGGSSSSSKSGDGKPLSEAMQTKLLNARDLYEKEKGSLSNVQDTIDALDKIKGEISDDDARDAINAMEYALNARREAVSWNDHGESGGKQNFIDYYDAVANAGYPELVSDLSALYDRAKNG